MNLVQQGRQACDGRIMETSSCFDSRSRLSSRFRYARLLSLHPARVLDMHSCELLEKHFSTRQNDHSRNELFLHQLWYTVNDISWKGLVHKAHLSLTTKKTYIRCLRSEERETYYRITILKYIYLDIYIFGWFWFGLCLKQIRKRLLKRLMIFRLGEQFMKRKHFY